MNISINIPSYKRPKVKTLEYISTAKVWIDESEYDEYLKVNNKENLVKVPKGIQGNVSRIRNYILDEEFKRGMDAVVLMDDDVDGIFSFEPSETFGYVKKRLEEKDLMYWLEINSLLCIELGYKLWGVNLNKDPRSYQHNQPISFSSIILGPFSCHIKNDIRYDEKIPLKEDYDLALQHLNKYRGILRLNKYHYDCKQSVNVGGCANMRNLEREKEQFSLLQKKWGSKIVTRDLSSKKKFDYNPIIRIPIRGV